MKKLVFGLLAICLCSALIFTGCSKKDASTGTKVVPKTPMQILTDRVNASDTKDSSQDQSIFDLSNRITNEIAAVARYDDAPIIARLGILEALNFSDLAGGLSFLTVRVASLESYNISVRLAALEARPIYNPNVSPTVTPNVSATPTPTPVTPTPTINCTLVTKPVSVFPTNGDMSVSNSTIMFQWSVCNATSYEFYFGNNSNTMTLIANTTDIPMYLKNSEIMPNTYYFWKVIAVSPCGNKSSSWWFKTQ
jgi:hypothetical protein